MQMPTKRTSKSVQPKKAKFESNIRTSTMPITKAKQASQVHVSESSSSVRLSNRDEEEMKVSLEDI